MHLNATHDRACGSWVESADRRGYEFPIQNLPFGIFRQTRVVHPAPVAA